jgi:hypothetical protein
MRKILVIRDGLQEIVEVGEGGGISIDSDTGLPVLEILWDEALDGPMTQEMLDNVGGIVITTIPEPTPEPDPAPIGDNP